MLVLLKKKRYKRNPILYKGQYPYEYYVKYGKYRRRVGTIPVRHILKKSYFNTFLFPFKRPEHGFYMRKTHFTYKRSRYLFYLKKSKKKKNLKIYKRLTQRGINLRNSKFSNINIVVKRRNTFINLSTRGKIFKSLSAGILGYTGRKKSAPIVRERIGRELASVAVKSSRNVVDLFLIKKKGRLYRNVIKGLACRGLYFRWIIIRHLHPHGHMRSRKKRRT